MTMTISTTSALTALILNGVAFQSEVVMLPHSAIQSSPLNPRRHFDLDKLIELAVNIHDETVFDEAGNVVTSGINQNLTARPAAQGVDIAAGERRWRAVGLLIGGLTVQVKTGEDTNGRPVMTERVLQVSADYPMPVKVKEMGDAELIELATLENIMREDLGPMEEADAYLALMAAGRTEDQIALKYGKHPNTVKSRLQLAAGLGRDGRKLLEAGSITLEHAKLIASTSGAMKAALLSHAKEGASVTTMKGLLRNGSFLVEHAVFDVAASGLRIEEGLIGDFPAKFSDPKKALNLQIETLTAQAAEQSARTGRLCEVVTVEDETGAYPPAAWTISRSGSDLVTTDLYIVSTVTGKHSVCPSMVRRADLKKPVTFKADATEAGGQEAGQTAAQVSADSEAGAEATQSGHGIKEAAHILARTARTQAISAHLATHPRHTLALACVALMKPFRSAESVLLLVTQESKSAPMTPETAALAAHVAAVFPALFTPQADGGLPVRNRDADLTEVLLAEGVSTDDLLSLFTLLTHTKVSPANDSKPGDRPGDKVCQFAQVAGLDLSRHFILTPEYLSAYRADALNTLITEMPAELRPVIHDGSSKKEIIGAIMEQAGALKASGWIPALVRFEE